MTERTLRDAAMAAVEAYDRANPMRTADWHGEDCDCFRCEMDRLRALLDAHTAAQPVPSAAPVAEPVAWRVRVKSDDPEEWSLLPAGGGADYIGRKGYECQPLYASPPPSAAPTDNTALALVEENIRLRSALQSIAHTFTENSYGDMQRLPAHEYQAMARKALTTAALASREAKPAPDHTDLSWAREICDDPEKLDAFMEAHPLPQQITPDAVIEPLIERAINALREVDLYDEATAVAALVNGVTHD